MPVGFTLGNQSVQMKIFESLQDRIPETGSLHRTIIVDSDSDSSRVSAVLIRVPPQYRFPLHIHSRSEDCFFVLSGGGEAFAPNQCYPVSEISGVWVPPGVPHGLAAGQLGVVEIGFQSPPGPTVDSIEHSSPSSYPYGIVAASVPLGAELDQKIPEWRPVFAERPDWQYLDPQYCCLEKEQQILAVADGYELFILVVRGSVNLQDRAKSLGAITMLQLDVGESEILHAVEANTFLLGVRASTT